MEALWNLLELPLEASGTLSGTFWEPFPKTFWNLLGLSDMRLPSGLLTSFSVCVGSVLCMQKVCLHLWHLPASAQQRCPSSGDRPVSRHCTWLWPESFTECLSDQSFFCCRRETSLHTTAAGTLETEWPGWTSLAFLKAFQMGKLRHREVQ